MGCSDTLPFVRLKYSPEFVFGLAKKLCFVNAQKLTRIWSRVNIPTRSEKLFECT